MQEHEIRTELHAGRIGEFGPACGFFVAVSGGADIDNVVVVFDRPVGGNMGNGGVELARRLLVLAQGRDSHESSSYTNGGNQDVMELHGRPSAGVGGKFMHSSRSPTNEA